MATKKFKKKQTVVFQEAEYKFISMLTPTMAILSSDGETNAFSAPLEDIALPGSIKKEYTIEERTEMIQQLLHIGSIVKTNTELYKELRGKVAENFFNNDKLKGTENLDLGNDYFLKCKKTISFKLDKKRIEEVTSQMDPSALEGLIKYEPKLSESVYNKLPADQKAIIDQIVTMTPGLPAFELVEPKVEKA